MQFHFDRMCEADRTAVIDIFNYFVENTYAAYPERKSGYELFDIFLKTTEGYPAVTMKTDSGDTVGFAWLRAWHAAEAFKRTAEITYFILPGYTRKGAGKAILDFFIVEARKLKVDSLLASISSLNEASLAFHRKNGFEECGRFRRVGRKFGRDFDVVWMQRLV